MGYYDGFLILSDIDGTLTMHGKVEPLNLAAIERFQAEGGRFSISTGRPPAYIPELEVRCNAPVATINGTLLCTPDEEVIKRLPLAHEDEFVLSAVLREFAGRLRYVHKVEEDRTIEWRPEKLGDDTSCLFGGGTTFKYLFCVNSEQTGLELLHMLTERYGDRYEFDRSWAVGVEVHAKDSGKGACVDLIRGLLPEVHTIISAGDYENDSKMLIAADVGCAVGNATASVKAIADRIVPPVQDGAIAYIIDVLIPELKAKRIPQRADAQTTLCYVQKDGCSLMLHRVKKERDENKDKWVGIGGHFEPGESPEDCVLREVKEETGLTLTSCRYRGIVTFVSDEWGTEYMHLFTADAFTGELADCDEGVLEWVPDDRVPELPSWEGDRIFLSLLARDEPFFSLKLLYRGDKLLRAVLNGNEMKEW